MMGLGFKANSLCFVRRDQSYYLVEKISQKMVDLLFIKMFLTALRPYLQINQASSYFTKFLNFASQC